MLQVVEKLRKMQCNGEEIWRLAHELTKKGIWEMYREVIIIIIVIACATCLILPTGHLISKSRRTLYDSLWKIDVDDIQNIGKSAAYI